MEPRRAPRRPKLPRTPPSSPVNRVRHAGCKSASSVMRPTARPAGQTRRSVTPAKTAEVCICVLENAFESSRRIFLILRRVLGLCAMSRYSKYHTTPREAGESERTAENARRIVWSTFDAGRAGRPAGEAPGPGPKPVRSPLPGPEVSDRIPIQTLVREFASTNCKHVYSFLGPYINSCDVVASDRIPSPFPTGLGQLPPITAPLLAQCPSPRQVWSQAGPVPGRHEKRQYGSRRQPRSAGWPNTPPPSGPTHPRPLRHRRHRSEAGP